MMDLLSRLLTAATLLSHAVVVVTSEASSAQPIGINDYAIASIFPDAGPVTGGTGVVLRGSGDIDGDGLTCVFGGEIDSAARWVSPTEVQCAAPEWSVAGADVSLRLELDGAKVATAPSLFHYYEEPVVESIYPTFGASLGGTTITVRGSGFAPLSGLSCRLGIVDLPAVWRGHDEVTCTSPPGVVASSQVLSLTLDASTSCTMPCPTGNAAKCPVGEACYGNTVCNGGDSFYCGATWYDASSD